MQWLLTIRHSPVLTRSALAVLLLGLACCAPPPDFSYADGASGHYADWDGRWVVINYWAEWCAPCREEIPQLNALDAALKGRGVRVVGVNYDGLRGPALVALMKKLGIDYPVMESDPRSHFEYALPSVLPTTVVIDPTGAVAATLVGPQTRASLEAQLGISVAL
jgi:thiol-disulfide isomerase/thioredoxin